MMVIGLLICASIFGCKTITLWQDKTKPPDKALKSDLEFEGAGAKVVTGF